MDKNIFDKNDSIIKITNKKYQDIIQLNNELQLKCGTNNNSQGVNGIRYNNKKVTLDDLIDITNSLLKENEKLLFKIQNDSLLINNHLQMFSQIEKKKLGAFKLDKGYITEFTYKQNKNDSLYQIINEIKSSMESKDIALKLIKNNYDLDFTEYAKDNKTYIKLTNTARIDSALWIYPYYKHKIKTNKKGETVIK